MPTTHSRRHGFTLTELIVASSLTVGAFGIVAPLTVRSGRLWQDARHQQRAMDELSNQLERLTSLPPTDRKDALAELAVSEDLKAMLPTATLTANVENDENGTRIVFGLNWDRPGKPQPVTLVGWLDPMPGTPTPGNPIPDKADDAEESQ